jgi:UDPglucose--hexose-1-phosphate uridylyltransferase
VEGQVEHAAPEVRPAYDPNCYLCPGNIPRHGEHNPAYESTFVFVNDFAAVLPHTPRRSRAGIRCYAQSRSRNQPRAVFFAAHDLTLAEMAVADIPL